MSSSQRWKYYNFLEIRTRRWAHKPSIVSGEFSRGRDEEGQLSIAYPSDSAAIGLYLLFATGTRPDSAAICDFADQQRLVSLGYDPTAASPRLAASDGQSVDAEANSHDATGKLDWIELVFNGLSFDLLGLSTGDPAAFPEIEHKFGLDDLPQNDQFEAVLLRPGPHLQGGARTIPVMKAMVTVARDLNQHFKSIEAVVWPHSKSAIGRAFFDSISTAWVEGGPFPALGLTAFEKTPDGAIQSRGLDFWLDQELRIEPPLSSDEVSATRLGVRLINHLIILGGIDTTERIVSPDGSRLLLTLSRNNKFIRVTRE